MSETRESDEELRGRAIESYDQRIGHGKYKNTSPYEGTLAHDIATAEGAALDAAVSELGGTEPRRTVQREAEAGRAVPGIGEVWRWVDPDTGDALTCTITDGAIPAGVIAEAHEARYGRTYIHQGEWEAGEWTRVSEVPKREPGPWTIERVQQARDSQLRGIFGTALTDSKPLPDGTHEVEVEFVPYRGAIHWNDEAGAWFQGSREDATRAANRSLCHDLARWDNAPAWARGYETVRQARREVVAPGWVCWLARSLEIANCQAVPVRLSRAALLEVSERDCEVGR